MRRFVWDDRKAASNLRKHGVSFDLAKQVFDDPFCVETRDFSDPDEPRWRVIGATAELTLLVVIHTSWTDAGDEIIRLISARKAERHERRTYEDNA